MAVPARHTSKAKKNKRRTHYKLTAPSVQFDETTGDYSRSHRVSLKGYYNSPFGIAFAWSPYPVRASTSRIS